MKAIDKIRTDETVERFRVLVVGPNGSGKSTLIRHLVDKQSSDAPLENIEFKLYEKNGRKVIIEYYEHFFNKLDKIQKQFFITKCNLVIVVIDLSKERNASTLKETITELNELIQLPYFKSPRVYIKGVDRTAEFRIFPRSEKTLFKSIIVLNKYDIFLAKKSISEIDLVEYIKSSYEPEDILFTSVPKQINLEKLKKKIFTILFTEISENYLFNLIISLNKTYNLILSLLNIHSIGKNHLIGFYEQIKEFAFNSQDQNIRIASFWALGELNNKEIIGKLEYRYRRYSGWDDEKFEMMIALLKLGDEPFSPTKTKQLVLKDYVLSHQKDLLNLQLKERGIYYTPKDNPKKIFIAFVEEEKRRATNLYKKLLKEGHKPWMYTEDGKGGSYWKEEIEREMNKSDYVIATFSKRSEGKDGYFNTEIRKAMEITHTKASGKRFLIPIKFDECKIPVMKVETLYLHDLNWIDFYRKNSYKKLLEAIELN